VTSLTLHLKVGDTLDGTGTYRDANGDPVDLDTAGITVTSAVLSADGTESWPVEVTPDPDQSANAGQYAFHADSSGWTAGKGLRWDIRYTGADGRSASTDTVTINLSQAIAPRPSE